MKSKKHILILTPGFPQSDDDSSCIPALQTLVRELHETHRQQIDLHVVSFQYPFKRGTYLWNGIPCWSAGGKNRKFPFKLLVWTRILMYIFRLHRKYPVDIVHSFWLNECTLIGQLFAWLARTRHIAHAMGQDVLPGNHYPFFLVRKSVTIIANSQFAANMLFQNFKWQPQYIVPFGIRPVDFDHVKLNHPRSIDLLNVGSLNSNKNQELFVAIFAELRKTFPALRGSILGDGPLMDELKKQIHQLGLDNCLLLEGKQDRAVVLQRMAESKILLHTSSFESAGYVMLEALHCGTNVVSFNTGYLPGVNGAFRCHDKSEMLKVLHHLFGTSIDQAVKKVPLISETVSEIIKIYTGVEHQKSTPEFVQ